jgi:large subunit ribosomal protein L10
LCDRGLERGQARVDQGEVYQKLGDLIDDESGTEGCYMKKLGLVFKETSEKHIKDALKKAESFFVLKYSGLSSPDMTTLRQALKETDAKIFVVKNTVARRALKESGIESLIKIVEGPCGFVFVKSEPANTSKVLFNFAKEHEQLKVEGGYLKDRTLDRKDFEMLAKLPSKEVLRAHVVGALNSPLVGLVQVLEGNLNRLVSILEQIKQKKQN